MSEARWIGKRIDLRWRDFDALGHVNHAVYLTLMSEARDALMSEGIGRPDGGYHFVIARLEIDWLHEVRMGTPWVEARSRVSRIGTKSVGTEDEIVDPQGVVGARAAAVLVRFDAGAGGAVALDAAERAGLEALLAPRTPGF